MNDKKNVYIAGFTKNSKEKLVATMWKNGEMQLLTDGTNQAEANSVFVSGDEVFVAGFEENEKRIKVATLWKNGVALRLSDGKDHSEARSVFVV